MTPLGAQVDDLLDPSGLLELRLRLPSSTLRLLSDVDLVEPELRRRLSPYVTIDRRAAERPEATILVRTAEPPQLPPGPTSPITIQSAKIERYRRSGLQVRTDDLLFTLNERSGTVYLTHPTARSICVVGRDPSAAAKDARRLVRDLYIADLKRTGHATLHAGSIALAGRCVLVVGGKGAGKSTFVLEALRLPGVDLVSNDRTFVRASADGLEAHGSPEHLLVRIGLLDQLPELRPHMPPRYADVEGASLWQLPDTEKMSLQFQDVASLFGSRVVPRAAIARLVLVDHRPSETSTWVERLSGPAAAEAVRTAYHEAPEYLRQPWHGLFELDLAAIAEQQRRVEEALVAKLPVFAFHRGRETGDVLKQVVRGVENR